MGSSRLTPWKITRKRGRVKINIWPNTGLAEDFPSARILYVSYSALFGKGSGGNSEMYILGENLASDFLQANIGQTLNCPVILVGHCFGGLMIKEFCLHISNKNLTRLESQRMKHESFLAWVKGIFYYGTPHRGSSSVDKANHLDNPLLGYFKVLSKESSWLNSEFSHLCEVRKWQTKGLGESKKTKQRKNNRCLLRQELSFLSRTRMKPSQLGVSMFPTRRVGGQPWRVGHWSKKPAHNFLGFACEKKFGLREKDMGTRASTRPCKESCYGRNKFAFRQIRDYAECNEIKDEIKALWLRETSPIQVDFLLKLKKLRYLEMSRVSFQREGLGVEVLGKRFRSNLSILRWWGSTKSRGQLFPITLDEMNILAGQLFPIPLDEMNNLAVLDLGYWYIPKGSLEALGNLTKMRILKLTHLIGLHSLPENFGNLSHLNCLTLSNLGLQRFPESLGNLSALEHLNLWDFKCLENLPESFGNLSSFVAINILRCPDLSSLPFGCNLKALKRLKIDGCPLLDRLPESFSQLSGLQTLSLCYCEGTKE